MRLYTGIDPTANFIHMGHMIWMRKLSEFHALGHEVIFLIGGFTAMIGDPDKKYTREPLTKEQVLLAMRQTKSNKAAARYLNVSYIHYKMWAKRYHEFEGGRSLFEVHKNQAGKGIPKFLPNKRKEPNIKIIVETGTGLESFTPEKIKSRLITEGYLQEECCKCTFNERRVTDYKMPLLLNFKDLKFSKFKKSAKPLKEGYFFP